MSIENQTKELRESRNLRRLLLTAIPSRGWIRKDVPRRENGNGEMGVIVVEV